ncbi:transcriptional regulator [Bacillus sp. HY001]|uniref:ParB N-terminal domain-containing protein n=1 Tax=Bacillus TaxID=1386 RepID=UPI00118686B5|nr:MULTISPECIES: ParB N-terminal domain-containing protein [Bacillus]TSI19901.1 transcriptional regulator [Bacillus sp. HY001]
MDIRRIPTDKINPAPYNPRIDLQPGDAEYEKLKQSVEQFGYVQPLVWNERTGNLVGGHQRFKILVNEMKLTEVEVSVVNLDDTEEKTLNITLNKVEGEWDEYKLEQLLQDLAEAGADLQITGFDENELAELLKIDAAAETEFGEAKVRENQELNLDDYSENNFDHTCPKCGFHFD